MSVDFTATNLAGGNDCLCKTEAGTVGLYP